MLFTLSNIHFTFLNFVSGIVPPETDESMILSVTFGSIIAVLTLAIGKYGIVLACIKSNFRLYLHAIKIVNAGIYYGRKYYLSSRRKKKVYVMDTDPDSTELDQKAALYSPSTGRMESGHGQTQGKFEFSNEVIYDADDEGKVVFESKLKAVDFDSLFSKTPTAKPAAAVSIKKPKTPLFGPRSLKIGVAESQREIVGLFSPSSPVKMGSFSLLEEEKEEEVKTMDIADIAAFKVKLDNLVAAKKPTFGLYATSLAKRLNNALLFIKPHAAKVGMQYLVSSVLDDFNIRVLSRGKYTAEEAEELRLFDRQYAYLEKFACNTPPDSIVLNDAESAAFQQRFAESWGEVVAGHRIWNATDASTSLRLNEDDLYALWKGSSMQLSVRRGLTICRVDATNTCGNAELLSHIVEPIYLINGFYPSMKASFAQRGATIHYMVVEWEGNELSWPDMLQKAIGHSDPALAAPSSVRGKLHQTWEDVGLRAPPDRRDNGVHISKSAFEGLVDRLIWSKGAMLFTDTFGSRLLSCNIPSLTVQNWLKNPIVQNKCIFDHMYGLEGEECLMKADTLIGTIATHHCLLLCM